jgi:3'-5' exoribonuclease
VLGDTLFRTCYGSAGKHHAYEGGLAVHVSEVVRGCLAMAEAYPEADKEVLIVSAIYHDFTKIYEYDVTKPGTGTYSDGEPVKYAKTQFSKYIRHVAGSYGEFLRNIDELDFPYSEAIMEKFMKIEHCILAHHGRREWGSPVEPQILEAQILHFADMLSYQYGEGR